jgi:hypothetical protein
MIRYVGTSAINKDNLLFFSCSLKKSRCDLPFLYSELSSRLRKINRFNHCHIVSYPYVSVVVTNRDASCLQNNFDEIKSVVEAALFDSKK